MSQHDDFGTFRALLQEPTLGSPWQLQRLLQQAAARDLTTLTLGKSALTTQGLLDILHGPHLTSLERLSATYINDPPPPETHDLAPCASPPHAATLRHLDLECARLGDRGVVALASSDRLAALTELDLSENRFGDVGVIALASSPYLSQLVGLSMHSGDGNHPNVIGLEGARALASSPHLTGLHWMDLETDPMGEEGVTLLLESDHLSDGIKESLLSEL